MKTTLEVPDSLLRRAKATALRRGQSMAAFINSAIEAKLKADSEAAREKPWMRFAGIFSGARADSKRLMRVIEEGCERVREEDWK